MVNAILVICVINMIISICDYYEYHQLAIRRDIAKEVIEIINGDKNDV